MNDFYVIAFHALIDFYASDLELSLLVVEKIEAHAVHVSDTSSSPSSSSSFSSSSSTALSMSLRMKLSTSFPASLSEVSSIFIPNFPANRVVLPASVLSSPSPWLPSLQAQHNKTCLPFLSLAFDLLAEEFVDENLATAILRDYVCGFEFE